MSGFEELSDFDFERFVGDLLSAHWGVRVETFPRGPDGGVDLRVLGPTMAPLSLRKGEELVVQCKHYPRGTFSALKPSLVREAAKPVSRQVSRYVFVTSARLTRDSKQRVVELLGPPLHVRDVFGLNDLEDVLRRHPEVEAANLKLWLTRTGTLQALVNQMEYLRTTTLIGELKRSQRLFVETRAIAAAQEILGRHGLCVLTGPPGAGKSTTASLLLLRYMAEGWQPAVAIEEVGELERQWRPGVKQVLLYDDFLGRNSLSAKLHKNEDSALVALMNAVEEDETKVFILTTRNYILKQAQLSYEKLNDPLFKLGELTVNVQQLDLAQRAHILYNHVYFSPLRDAGASLTDGPGRIDLVRLAGRHSYSPRLIDEAIKSIVRQHFPRQYRHGGEPDVRQGKPALTAADILRELELALGNPGTLWEHVFAYQLSIPQRNLLIALVSYGTAALSVPQLIQAAQAFGGGQTYELHAALHVLDGDLVSVAHGADTPPERTEVDLRGPGVADALISHLRRHPDVVRLLTESASSFEQVKWLAAFAGVGRYEQPSSAQTDSTHLRLVCSAAQRTFTTAGLVRTLFGADEDAWYQELGDRMTLFARICTAANFSSDEDFIRRVSQAMISNIDRIELNELLEAVTAMGRPSMNKWRPFRTVISDMLLRDAGSPETLDGWKRLMDVMDVVVVADEFNSEAVQQFETFAEEMITVGQERFEDDPIDLAQDSYADELRELKELADRRDLFLPELDELLEQIDEIVGSGLLERAE